MRWSSEPDYLVKLLDYYVQEPNLSRRAPLIRAIPTTYQGVTFRSRLESQWARLLDALAWRWTYEPDLQAGLVIPDFLIDFPARPVVLECKPALTVGELTTERRALIRKMPGWLENDVLRELRVLAADPLADHDETRRALADLDRVASGDNPTGHTRRVLVVGPQLMLFDEVATVDGVYGLCLCTGARNHVGMARSIGDACLYCGSDARVWLPPQLALGAWREAGSAQQWQPSGRGGRLRVKSARISKQRTRRTR